MRAAALTDDHTFEVVDVPDPTPGAGELVLRVTACGICGSDLKSYKSMPGGTVMGHEFCGEVVAVGAEVEGRWREGTHVAAMPISACGRCRWCQADEPVHCEQVDLIGMGAWSGGFAELIRVDAGLSVPLPSDLGRLGALVEPLSVGLHAVEAADVQPGDRVLIIGGGNVGAAVAVWASRAGAAEVVVSDPNAARRATAGRFGATGVHDPVADGPASGFEVVIECVGTPGMIQAAIQSAAVRGRVVVAGACMAPDQLVPIIAVMKEVSVRFVVYYRGHEWQAAADLLEQGGVDIDAFVSGTVGLDGVGPSFHALLAGTADGKVLVTP